MRVTEVIPFVTERYPWTHRVELSNNTLEDKWQIEEWIDKNEIDGLWVNNGFYTTQKVVTMLALKWGHL